MTGESSRAAILIVAPPSPTTTHLFLDAAAAVAVKGDSQSRQGWSETK